MIARLSHPRSRGLIGAASVLLIGILAWSDFMTGWEISFPILYLMPVVLAARYGHSSLWSIVAAVSAAVSLAVDLASGRPYAFRWMPMWNATARLGMYLFVGRMVALLRRHLESERTMARTDPLTGLMNRRAFDEALAIHFEIATRQPQEQTLVFLDVDDFKLVNDRRGHAEGDRLLAGIAGCVKERLRRQDVAARLGGDEFGIFLPSTGSQGAEIVVAKLRDSLRQLVGVEAWNVTFSVGAATFRRPPGDPETAIAVADQLMYEVKRSTKDGCTLRVVD